MAVGWVITEIGEVVKTAMYELEMSVAKEVSVKVISLHLAVVS